jgi:hypothetical protein
LPILIVDSCVLHEGVLWATTRWTLWLSMADPSTVVAIDNISSSSDVAAIVPTLPT